MVPGAVSDVADDRRFVSVEGSDTPEPDHDPRRGAINDPRTAFRRCTCTTNVIEEVSVVTSGQTAAVASGDGA
jgi:hypothetical protein